MTETLVLGGGCFWCTEAVYVKVRGVTDVESGYCNGHTVAPTYEDVCTGRTGHNEVVKLEYDPAQISTRELLEILFVIHDPTTPNRQGNDLGASYRSAIYYLNEQQRDIAEDTAADVDASKLWPGRVVTEIEPAGPFWEAEPEHQDYLERIPNGYTCHFPRAGWVLPKRNEVAAG